MKKLNVVLLGFLGVVLFSNYVSAQKGDYVALYRLYSDQTRDHLYTTDCNEKETLLRSGSYTYEGVSGYISSRQSRQTVPVYRISLNGGEHFYTTDYNEMTTLSQNGSGQSEGIVGYLAKNSSRDTVPFYRLINNDRHLYTSNEQEKNSFLQNYSSKLESTIGYIWTSGTNACDSGNYRPDNRFPSVNNRFPFIYDGTNFDGAAQSIERDWTDSNDWDGSPHTIRSIRVPRGWFLVLYTKRDFRGQSYNLNSNITFAPGDQWYNKIRSIKVYQGNPPQQQR